MEEKRPSGETWLTQDGLKCNPLLVETGWRISAKASCGCGSYTQCSTRTQLFRKDCFFQSDSHLMIMWLQTDSRLKEIRESLGRAFLEDCHLYVITWSERSLLPLFLWGKNRCRESVEKEGRKTATWNLIKPRTLLIAFSKTRGWKLVWFVSVTKARD